MFPLSKGRVARQAHVGLPDGTFEEEHGREAFDGRASHLYRTHPPTAWIRIEGDLRPRAYDLNGLKTPDQADPAGEWLRILHNEDVSICLSKRTEPMPYYLRDSDGDVCYFVHRGSGLLETDYGPLRYREGDFLVLPKGTTHRLVPDGETFLYVIEGRGEYRLPDKGILGRHALFDPGVLEVPEPQAHDEKGEFDVRVKRDDVYTTLVYPFHPLDVVGWQGDLCPVRINREDFRPVVSPRYHLPPSVHAVWKSDGFEIGLFAPRPTETGDPSALRVPFFHSNIDKDEVLFYHQGQFFSRAGIGEAFADEYAVMVEADQPFQRDDALATVEIDGYATSWARGMGLID
jgi:homogentisate 1,2-dioxygenase